MGGAYFDYDETAALAGKTDPSPFREGKVRTSLGGPGHFNSSPFNRALRLPQYIAPPEEYKDLIINLEKQVAELKDENIRLKNIMLISSPAALYNEYGGPMGSKLSGLMSPTGKLIYESPHRKSPVKKNSTGNQDGEDEGENQNSHSTDHVNNDTTESNPTTARSTNQQNQHVEFSHHDQLESSSVPTIARPILNPTTATSQSMSPLAKKKSYMSALTSPLKRENKLVYQSLSPVRHSNSGHSVAPTVGPLDLQSDWAEDRQESNAELMVLLKTFQESLVKYGPSRHEVCVCICISIYLFLFIMY